MVSGLGARRADNQRVRIHIRKTLPASVGEIIGCLILAMVVLVGSSWSRTASAGAPDGEPWYRDVSPSYWAYWQLYPLWQAGVLDGNLRYLGGGHVIWSYFRPDDVVSRGEYAIMAAKAFQLAVSAGSSFADVPESRLVYDRIALAPWVGALEEAGWVSGFSFFPDNGMRRDQATAFLIHGLDLTPESQRLSPDDVDRLLARFPDQAAVSLSVRAEVALAVYLGIVEGYPDGTLRPAYELTRAEAAAELYRAAMLRLNAEPAWFTPDGDGVGDLARITTHALLAQATTSWQVFIEDLTGRRVRTLGMDIGALPAEVLWDGRDDGGQPAADGEYRYAGSVTNRLGLLVPSLRKPLYLFRRGLSATLEPKVVTPGGQVFVQARTRGDAQAVTVALPTGATATLYPAGETAGEKIWSALLSAPAVEGRSTARVRADFGEVVREVNLPLDVQQNRWLEAQLRPNPAPAGRRVHLILDGSPDLSNLTVTWPDDSSHRLATRQPGHWDDNWLIPSDTSDGAYPVRVVADTALGTKLTRDVTLIVDGTLLEGVRFILSD